MTEKFHGKNKEQDWLPEKVFKKCSVMWPLHENSISRIQRETELELQIYLDKKQVQYLNKLGKFETEITKV